MVKLDFHDPSGSIEVTQAHARRLKTLEGKRIGIVTNEQWQAFRTLAPAQTNARAGFSGRGSACN